MIFSKKLSLLALSSICALPLYLQADDSLPPGLSFDTRGPIQNTGMMAVAQPDGVQAPDYTWTPFPEVTTWTAHWTGSAAHRDPNCPGYLARKTIDLPDDPSKVVVYLTAHNYILFVNGHMAARGPADFGHDFSGATSGRWFYDARDLTPLFHKGKNALALFLPENDGFLFQGTASFANAPEFVIKSDESWKEMSCPFFKSMKVPADLAKKNKEQTETVLDATLEPVDWTLPFFDDSNWPPCKTGDMPPGLTVSELPPLMEVNYPYVDIKSSPGTSPAAVSIPDHPLTENNPIVFNSDGGFIVHTSRILSGRVSLLVKGVKGTTLTLNLNENSGRGGRTFVLMLRDGLQTFFTPTYCATGAVTLTASGVTQPVSILSLSCENDCQPVAYKGSFSCSDEELNHLWISGRWSTQICMQTHHLDSPQHQEPIADYGDYLIADLVNFYSMGNNPWLARQDLRKFSLVLQNAKYQTFHTSYIFFWLQSLINYYDYTGDASLVKELAPTAHGIVSQFKTYIGPNGIISNAPNYMFMDWVQIDKIACHHPPAVIGQGYMTALFIHALEDAGRISALTGDETHVQEYKALHDQLIAAYNNELWNSQEGLYRDGKPFVVPKNSVTTKWLPADTQIETFSVQNNALAVLYDIAPKDRQGAVIDKLMTKQPLNATPYFLHFVLNAIQHAGKFDQYGTELLRTWKIVPETQTVREMGTSGDYSHGWIATPTYQMSSHILGVTPSSPGFETFAIAPQLCDLKFAKGVIPSPHGPISVDWTREPNAVTLKVTVPSGSKAVVRVPGNPSAVTLNGQTAQAELKLDPGTYTISATGNYAVDLKQ